MTNTFVNEKPASAIPDSLWNLVGREPTDVDLVSTTELLVRVRSFAPGTVFANHFHTTFDEIFIGLTGTLTVWLGESDRREISPSVTVTCARQQHHYIANNTDAVATIVIIKSPNNADDSTLVEWHPPVAKTTEAAQ